MRKSRKTIIISGTVAGVLVGGAAFAYWTSTGNGSGSASTAAGAGSYSVSQTSSISQLKPGGAAQTIAGTVTNGTDSSARVQQVVVSISSVTKGGNVVSGCDASDYTLSGATMLVGQEVAAGSSVPFSGATIAFNNKADSNQDACKGATVNLSYLAS